MIGSLFPARGIEFRAAVRTATEGMVIARDVGDVLRISCFTSGSPHALQHLGEWGMTVATITEGLRMAAQIGHRSRPAFCGWKKPSCVTMHWF
jgi:hypothetical protein